jgi:hypothetical protein
MNNISMSNISNLLKIMDSKLEEALKCIHLRIHLMFEDKMLEVWG